MISESVAPVFTIPAITWTFTAVLLLSGGYHLLHAARSHQFTDRVNESLHGFMNVLMVAMLWNLASSTMLAQIAVLTGAALWFVIQAVARPEFKILCAGRQGRLKCVYHSITMAGAAFMVAMMAPSSSAGHGPVPASTNVPHGHHAMAPADQTQAAQGAADSGTSHLPDLALLLTALFGVAAVVFLVLLLRGRTTKARTRNQVIPWHFGRTEHGLQALGAAAMALMFATMTA
ncbi:hypothetical protein RCH21_003456 [Arthrobacter sp. PL16]|nr:hypothetical protein [Arthrobacter sp. PL16]